VQIQRYNPQLARYVLEAAYGGYDPVFNISGQHNFDMAPSSYNPYSTTVTPNTKYDEETRSLTASTDCCLGDCNTSSAAPLRRPMEPEWSPVHRSRGSSGVTLTQPLLKNFWIDDTRLNIRVANPGCSPPNRGCGCKSSARHRVARLLRTGLLPYRTCGAGEALDLARTHWIRI